MAQAGQTDQQMSSSSSNGAERDLGGDVDKDKQTKPKPKPILFRYCSTGSRYRIYNNCQSSLYWYQLAVVEQQDIQNICSCNILYIQYIGCNYWGIILDTKEGSSICPAKYIFLAMLGAQQQQCSNVSTSTAATATLQQKLQCNRSHSATEATAFRQRQGILALTAFGTLPAHQRG